MSRAYILTRILHGDGEAFDEGQVVLPKTIRESRGWRAGMEFLVEETAQGILLRPVRPFPPTRVEDIAGCLAYSKTVLLEADWVLRSVFSYTDEEVREAFAGVIGIPTTHVEGGAAVQEALRLVEEGFDFADALHLAYRPAGAVFVSFDEKLVRRAQRAGVPDVVLAGRTRLN